MRNSIGKKVVQYQLYACKYNGGLFVHSIAPYATYHAYGATWSQEKKHKKHLRIHKHKATCQQVSWNKVIYWDSYPCEPKKHGHVTLSLTNKHWLMFGVNQEKLYVLEINQQAWVIQPAKIGQIVWFSRDLIKKKTCFPQISQNWWMSTNNSRVQRCYQQSWASSSKKQDINWYQSISKQEQSQVNPLVSCKSSWTFSSEPNTLSHIVTINEQIMFPIHLFGRPCGISKL